MKKITLLVFALFFVAGLSAQPLWGVKGGLNSAIETSKDGNTKPRTGLHLGIYFESALGNMVDIQPELVYSMQGGVDVNNASDRINYINLPVIFKIYVDDLRTFSIDFGPQVGYMVSAKYKYNGVVHNVYDNGNFNKLDAAFCLGVTYKIDANFNIGLRYNISASKIVEGYTHRNLVGQLGIGYTFRSAARKK